MPSVVNNMILDKSLTMISSLVCNKKEFKCQELDPKYTVMSGVEKGAIKMKFLQTASTAKLLVSFEKVMYG